MTQSSPRPTVGAGSDSDAVQAGLAPGTLVMTLDGAIPVEFLNPGDRIVTRRGARVLKSVMRHTIPAGTARILVSADAFGGKPAKAMTLLPSQRILIRDWRAKALWGKDIAAPQIARLVDGEHIRVVRGDSQMMLALYFGAPEVLYADGLELASADRPRVTSKA